MVDQTVQNPKLLVCLSSVKKWSKSQANIGLDVGGSVQNLRVMGINKAMILEYFCPVKPCGSNLA